MGPLDAELESRMLAMIDGVLAGTTGFHDFASRYYRFVVDEIPTGALADRGDFFDDAQEKLDDVSWEREEESALTPYQRQTGALTRDEYLTWLRDRREAYRSQFGR